MCEDHYHDPDLETDNDDSDLDMLEYYDWREEPPSKPKYYPAAAPTPLADRLAYYKYELKFRKFCNNMRKLFTRLEFNADKQPKKKLLCVRLGTEYFALDPKSVDQKTPFTEVGMYGVMRRFPSAPPNITMTAHVVTANEKEMWRKYEYLRKHFHGMISTVICGERWYAVSLDYSFHSGSVIEVGFQLPADVKQLLHQHLRDAEAEHKKRFAKFASLT
jgi:hypothetical protein